MKPIAKILVPVDLSAGSLGTAAYAMSLARDFGSELLFLHVLQNGWPLSAEEREIRDQISAAAGAPRFLFREGSAAQTIINTAETERVDLIRMPTRGRRALTRLFAGSVAAQVLRGAACPVWVGLDGRFPFSSRPIRNILCGLSLGPRASAVLRWAVDLAARFRACLTIIHAGKPAERNPSLLLDDEWWLRRTARQEILDLQTGTGKNGQFWLAPGKPLDTIPPLAGEIRADLLVLGKSPQKRFLNDLRTLSYEITCRAPCPVASV